MDILDNFGANLIVAVVVHISQKNEKEFLDIKLLIRVLHKMRNTQASFSTSFQIEFYLMSFDVYYAAPS